MFHQSEDLALGATTRLFVASNHVFLQRLYKQKVQGGRVNIDDRGLGLEIN